MRLYTRKRLPRSGFVQTALEEINGDLLEEDFYGLIVTKVLRFFAFGTGRTAGRLPGDSAARARKASKCASAILRLRATGITDYLKSDGTLEHAQMMAAHSFPRTTRLQDRRNDETALDEYEKVRIWFMAEDMENAVMGQFSFHEILKLYRKCIPEFVDGVMKFRQLDSIFVVGASGASSLSDKLTDL